LEDWFLGNPIWSCIIVTMSAFVIAMMVSSPLQIAFWCWKTSYPIRFFSDCVKKINMLSKKSIEMHDPGNRWMEKSKRRSLVLQRSLTLGFFLLNT
jgi:hypothetical protein